MRLVSIFLCSLISLSLGATTLKLESQGYALEALLETTTLNFAEGTVHAPNAQMGVCKGKFSYDASAELFSIEFENTGGCNKENIEVDITSQNLINLTQGQRVQVNFRSGLFYMRDMKGFVRVVAS